MVFGLALLLPLVLLAVMLVMERVERPLRDDAIGEQVEHVLDRGRADEVERLVRDGFAPSVERYWRRRRLGRLFAGRSGS